MIKQLKTNKMNNLKYKTMRKIAFILLMLLTLSLNAQDNDEIIKFVGIPVDGTKSEMISKLKQKGFTFDNDANLFKGEFNGDKISGIIQTYKDKVFGIRFMYDVSGYSKTMVINRFNSLVLKYDTNEKYQSNIAFDKITDDIDTYQIDPYENIGNEMRNGKIYKAQYHYKYGKNLSDTTGLVQYKKEMPEDLASFIESNYGDSGFEALYIRHKLEQDVVQFYIIDMGYDEFNIMFDYYNRRNAPNDEDL